MPDLGLVEGKKKDVLTLIFARTPTTTLLLRKRYSSSFLGNTLICLMKSLMESLITLKSVWSI